MACCVNCFLDKEIIGLITSQSKAFGSCNYCNSTDVNLIEPGELEDSLYYILNSYTNHPTSVLSTGVDSPSLMHEHIKVFWPKLFNSNNLSDVALQQLLFDIAGTFSVDNISLLSQPVELKCFLNPTTLGEASLQETKWIQFTSEIKDTNRFFVSNTINLDILAGLLDQYQKRYSSGIQFFRSRLTEGNKFKKTEMGKPPAQFSKAGRANPKGIPYLYLAHDKLTTIYEARASLNDRITIGTFRLTETIKVLSLTDILSISPTLFADELDLFMLYRKFMQRLSYELSKPIRKTDSELDYLPTQYLCEYIKFCKFDAVEYQSSLNPSGVNIVLFDDSKVECIRTALVKIDNLHYAFDKSF